MIFVLTRSAEYANYYKVDSFKSKQEAMQFILKESYYPNDYVFIEGDIQTLTLTKEGREDE